MAQTIITTPYPTLDELAAAVGITPAERAHVEKLVREMYQKPVRRSGTRRNGKRPVSKKRR